MFKIVENDDGSTTVYCRDTGKLICSVPIQKCKPLGIGRPIPRTVDTVNPKLISLIPQTLSTHQPPPQYRYPSSPSTCDVTANIRKLCDGENLDEIAFKSDFSDTQDLDYSEDCITNEQFLQSLDLVRKTKLKENSFEKLRSEFPMRQISRIKLEDTFFVPPETKILEDVDMISPLGKKLLQVHPACTKNLINDATAMLSIKKYDNYCRFALGSLYLSGFPKLRCRELKKYPLTYRPLKSWGLDHHTYSFNREQRIERMKTLKTGLNRRARKLKRQCRKLSISVTKIKKEEIKKWTTSKDSYKETFFQPGITSTASILLEQQRSNQIAINLSSSIRQMSGDAAESSSVLHLHNSSDIKVSNLPSRLTSCNTQMKHQSSLLLQQIDSSPSRYISRGKLHSKASANRRGTGTRCKVVLEDVLQKMVKVENKYYVSGTRICVCESQISNPINCPAFSIQPPSSSTTYARLEATCHKESLSVRHQDHAYHRPPPSSSAVIENSGPNSVQRGATVWTAASLRNAVFEHGRTIVMKSKRLPTNPPTVGAVVPFTAVKPPSVQRVIPVIDLVDDEAPPNPPPPPTVSCSLTSPNDFHEVDRFTVSTWVFHCFGCSFKTGFMQKSEADAVVQKHMVGYHSVSQPEPFLNKYLDTTNHSLVIEAFPGYKNSI